MTITIKKQKCNVIGNYSQAHRYKSISLVATVKTVLRFGFGFPFLSPQIGKSQIPKCIFRYIHCKGNLLDLTEPSHLVTFCFGYVMHLLFVHVLCSGVRMNVFVAELIRPNIA